MFRTTADPDRLAAARDRRERRSLRVRITIGRIAGLGVIAVPVVAAQFHSWLRL